MARSSTSEVLRAHCAAIAEEEAILREGGGKAGHERQRKMGRLSVRERIRHLLDKDSPFFEIELWAAYKMYEQWGKIPAAGVVTGIGNVEGVPCMIVANDATVKAGAFFPATTKKVIRAQRIAFECALPLVYLVDSAGVFLPMQDEIFPDEDDFGRIFRNNSVISAAGVPQFAAIMGNCVAGGAYLPVLCDKILMTEGSGLYLAGPSLVKAAIGQVVDAEELGGARMHSEISGTVDFFEKDDPSCLKRLRSLVALLPEAKSSGALGERALPGKSKPAKNPDSVYDLISFDGRKNYDVRDLLATVVDENSLDEYKADYGKTLVTAYARINGRPVGIVANQRVQVRTKKEGIQMGGVIYSDSADKAARFVMDCNQTNLPIIFFQDVSGFMVGRDAEESGIIRSGAKLVNAVSNSVVPKITVIVGGSFGAGNYAMCGKAYDPRFIVAWPNARYAVMGAAQASDTVFSILARAHERGDKKACWTTSRVQRRKRISTPESSKRSHLSICRCNDPMPVVLIEKESPQITVVTLNRPERRNALTLELLTELCAAIKVASEQPEQRVLILRGSGVAFCTGLDLKEAADSTKAHATAEMVANTLVAISQTRLVTIAAVHGAAVAGGAGIMSACDFVVAAERTKIGYPEVRRGLVAGLVMTFLRRQVGERNMRELLFSGDLIDAARAREIGLVNRVVVPDDLMNEAQKFAASVLQGAPGALAQTKRLVEELWWRSVKEDVDVALRYHMQARESEEAHEGIAAFNEKRKPNWTQ